MSSVSIFRKDIPYTFKDPSLLDVRAYVDGGWRNAIENKTFPVEDPSDQQILAHVSDCSVAEYEQAIEIAHQAFTPYKNLTPRARGELLRKWAQCVRESSQDLAALCVLELGKPFKEALTALSYAARCLDWFASLAEQGCGGETIPNSSAGGRTRIFTIRQPVGVVCAITPWNSPYSGVLKKIAPALAVGCTVVHKPAPETPLCAIALAKTCERAGFPPGAYNMLTSSSENAAAIGSLFCSHQLVRHVTFTGSSAVGKFLAERCGANLKRMTMELGGNAAFIVFDDANLDLAIKVNSKIQKMFVQKLLEAIRQHVHLGSPWDAKFNLGPLYAKKGAEKVQMLLKDAIKNGAELLTPDTYQEGSAFYPPSVVVGVNSSMQITQEEIFGPLVSISTFETEEDAIKLANDVTTGLAGYVFTENISRLFRVAEALHAGMVGAQTGSISAIEQPFGGIKDSGMGREGSVHAMEEYTELKAITLAL
ncbi:succinate-semialdehyde dehydrogenase [Trichoderma arundinaceum]|uniref:Succinate-semialdehyde dehydrogenase n=1 Tax=Trichoderma arundinaceum TaxID=490622 RepID=A0A395N9R4_TRIAR|nr:succinate-semialdehyde dehydrogenase [Trichoderma arundinaceum]